MLRIPPGIVADAAGNVNARSDVRFTLDIPVRRRPPPCALVGSSISGGEAEGEREKREF